MQSLLYPTYPVLIIDDEPQILEGFSFVLKMAGINHIFCCHDSREVMNILENHTIETILLDLTMPFIPGETLLELINKSFPEIPIIIVTGNNEVDIAVRCMQQGAQDYILKPVEENRLVGSIKKAIEMRELRQENRLLKQKLFNDKLDHPEAFSPIITKDKNMNNIFQYMEAIRKTNEPLLITGETGTGKELIARAFHNLSGRKGKFVTVNVAGLDDHMFSDSLFGHKKGAFTDAAQPRPGLIESAVSGTILLDEIGDMNTLSQVKLLRLLQEKEYYPLGEDEPRYSNALIIAATNKNLLELHEEKKFRKDLFYRLDVHHIHLPPLRQRLDDIPLLVDFFLQQAAISLGKKKPTPPPELFNLLATYHFPGNIRELRSMIYKAVSHHQARVLSLELFKNYITSNRSISPGPLSTPPNPDDSPANTWINISFETLPTLKEVQNWLIHLALKRAGNNQGIAAQMLGISQQALSKRLKKKALNQNDNNDKRTS